MKRHITTLLIALAAIGSAFSQTPVSNYLPGANAEGTVYFLPKVAVRASILVERTQYEPGRFAKYASRYLRLTGIGQEPTEQYRIVGVRQTAVGVTDTTKCYVLHIGQKGLASKFSSTDDGRLLAVNAEALPESEPKPFVAARQVPLPDATQYLSEEIVSAGSVAKMAELTAREIYDLRENRNLLIKGQADFMPSDGQQMQLMLQNIDRQDQALTRLFAGTTRRDTTETVVYFCPEGPVEKQVLFRLSQYRGVVDVDDLSGTPYYIYIDDLNSVPPVDDELAAKHKRRKEDAALYFNVPGRMRSTIKLGATTVIDSAELPAPQFGNVEQLSTDLFTNKKFVTRVWLNSVTGAVDKIESEAVGK